MRIPQEQADGPLLTKSQSADARLDAMTALIRLGSFQQAAELGNGFRVPLAISTAELQVTRQLAEVQNSTLDVAEWMGQQVVQKKPKITTSADLERFRAELKLMLRCGHHHNILPLLAARAIPPGYLLVVPLMPTSLASRIQGGKRLGWQQVCAYGLQLAEGLGHLHACGIQHRDVKPANILIVLADSEGDLRLSDFGIAIAQEVLAAEQANADSTVGRVNPSGGFHKRHMVGTQEYMAPEILLRQSYGFPADMYAWAVTVNEAATGIRPYSDCTRDNPAAHTVLDFGYGRQELTAAIVSQGLRPHMAPDIPIFLGELLESCWQLDPAARPTAEQVVRTLRDFIASKAPCLDEGRVADDSRVGKERQRQEARRAQAPAMGDLPREADIPGDQHPGKPATTRKPISQTLAWARSQCQAYNSESCSSNGYFQQKISVGSFATAGARGEDRMEDRCCIATPVPNVQPETHLLAVFDGHRGAGAANYAAEHIEQGLRSTWACHSGEEALQECFASIDQGFCHEEEVCLQMNGRHGHEGCTALAAVISGRQLWIASTGDCRAVLCRAGQAVQLNPEHTLELSSERQRIQAAGGELFRTKSGWRLGEAGIQISRAIGDADLKSAGLTAEPEVVHSQLLPEDTCLILASDGLWDCLSSQDAADLIRDTVKEPVMCAQRLATEALTRGSGDNITAIVAFLRPMETVERVYASV